MKSIEFMAYHNGLSALAEYIQTIMMMEESVQHVVMTAIQEVDCEPPNPEVFSRIPTCGTFWKGVTAKRFSVQR